MWMRKFIRFCEGSMERMMMFLGVQMDLNKQEVPDEEETRQRPEPGRLPWPRMLSPQMVSRAWHGRHPSSSTYARQACLRTRKEKTEMSVHASNLGSDKRHPGRARSAQKRRALMSASRTPDLGRSKSSRRGLQSCCRPSEAGASVPAQMSFLAHTQVLIPALNEEESIGETLGRWLDPGANCVRVVDNGSVDATALRARAAGADVVHEPARGYGAAAWTGLQHWPAGVSCVLFSSGDSSDRIEPGDLCSWQAAVDDGADLVLGDRTQSSVSRSVLKLAQSVGNRICCQAISLGWGATFQDMASLRLVRHDALMSLGLKDRGSTAAVSGASSSGGQRHQVHRARRSDAQDVPEGRGFSRAIPDLPGQ